MIFNRHMLAKGLGNVSYMNSCRALYYRCLVRFPRGAPRLPSGDSCSYFTHPESVAKTKVGAFYNNDHFARFCAARLHHAASRRPSTSPRRDGAAAFVASEAGSVRSSPTATVPRIRHAVDGRAFFWFL